MKTKLSLLAAGMFLAATSSALATVRFVNVNNANPTPPYTNWATAATNIQDAVDAAGAGDEIVVTNGTYAGGSLMDTNGEFNSVLVTKLLTVRSVNGPGFSVIDGGGAARCVYLTNDAVMVGFTLTNGVASLGGGVYCESASAVLSNCVLSGNWASGGNGGGAYGGTLNNCTLTGNSAWSGGGAQNCTLNNCTLTGNTASGHTVWWFFNPFYIPGNGGGAESCTLNNCTLSGNSAGSGGGAESCILNNCTVNGNWAFGGGRLFPFGGAPSGDGGGADNCTLINCTLTGNSASDSGGGSYSCTLNNCIVYFNSDPNGGNYDPSSTLNYCCTTPMPTNGVGNISADPQLASASHLSAESPCIRAGSARYASGTDIDGEPWANPPSIGCDEYHAGAVVGPLNLSLTATLTNVVVGYPVGLAAFIEGRTDLSVWEFGDGLVEVNQPYTSHSWTVPGDYLTALWAFNESYPAGVRATVTIHVEQGLHYVAASSSNPVAPYTSWATAATNIQDAVDVAPPGATIFVTNGTYTAGGRTTPSPGDGTTNRVAVDKPLTVRSVNGPGVTVIQGQVPGATNDYIRCVYLTNAATLVGFTLTNGVADTGAGVYCESTSAVLSNCVLSSNSAWYQGGGAYGGTLNTCTLTGNSAGYYGGGAQSCTLNNCTLTRNSDGAESCTLNNCAVFGNTGGGAVGSTLNNCTVTGNSGWGAMSATLNNCIVYFNADPNGGNFDPYSTLNYCCTTPVPANGVGNISADPQLADPAHLSAGSPCRGAGSRAYAFGTDIDGEPWANPPSIGCDEFYAGAVNGPLSVAIFADYTNVATGFAASFTAQILGHAGASIWDFGDGTAVSNRPYASHAWTATGNYPVTLRAYSDTYPGGVAASLTVHVARTVYYVALSSTSPVAPYSSWATAARNIQDAVDATSLAGALVLVSNGVYQTGSRYVHETNRVAVSKPVTVRSVNGPEVTVINGSGTVRCLYLTNATVVAGFTLANGSAGNGGGVYCESTSAVLSNCVLSGNSAGAPGDGGGAYGGTLNNCTLSGNSAFNFGGGASGSTLNNCTLTGNSARFGGGASGGALNNCTLTGNSASFGGVASGGGAYESTLNNCTLTSNSANYNGGGAYSCTLNNCIVYFNSDPNGGNYDPSSTLNYCCTTPMPTNGVGNISADPQLASASHLSAESPCIGAGSARYASGTDIDGEAWANPPSIGCDEYHGGAVMGPLTVSLMATLTNVAVGYPVGLTAFIGGRTDLSVWEFGDGLVEVNQPYTSHAWTAPGDYLVALWAFNDSYPAGVRAAVTIHVEQGVHYVAASGSNPVAPYTSWATAAMNIQDAVDAAPPGATIFVTNGTYAAGGRTTPSPGDGAINRVAVDKPLTLRSVNGPGVTVIQGQMPGATNGYTRCVYLTNAAALVGFTLTNGWADNGGGAWCESTSAVLFNCVLSGNSAGYSGGGAYSGTLSNCMLTSNEAWADFAIAGGGGAYGSTLNNCRLTGNGAYDGGGAFGSTLNNCTLTGNVASASVGIAGGGGGAFASTLNNCTLTGNLAWDGGGAALSTLNNCTLTGNSGSGASGGTLNNCTLTSNTGGRDGFDGWGGGAYYATLNNCTLSGNSAGALDGGGAYGGTLNNCTLTGNSARYGGGAYSDSSQPCTLNNCTLTGNSAEEGGGAFDCTLNNCIVYFNTATNGANYYQDQYGGVLTYCCTTPMPTNGVGNITNAPLFVDQANGNLRLQFNSPCINSGNNAYATGPTDLDGNPRIVSGTVDIGAYEYQTPTSVISYAWLQQYGLPTDGSADFTDPDRDGMNNWQEWIAGTNPTNTLSVLKMLAPVRTNNPAGLVVTWQSVNTRTYYLQSSTNLAAQPGFSTIQSNIVGQAGTTSYTDTTATNAGPYFYRVGVGN